MGSLRALAPYFRRYRWSVAFGVASSLAAAVVGLASPIVVGRAVDSFLVSLTGRSLAVYGLALLGITLVQGIFSFLQRTTLVRVSRDIENDLRNDYFAHLERQDLAFFNRHATGDLMALGTNDLQAVRMICGPAIMYSSSTFFTAAGALFFMAGIHGRLTLVALATMPLVALATKVVGQRTHALFGRVQEQFAALSARVQENLAGARVVRAYAREAAEARRFEELGREYVSRSRKLIRWSAAFSPLLQLLVGFGFVAVLWYGGTLVWRNSITVGEFVTFNFFVNRLVWPMIAIGWVTNLVQRGRASLERILEVLETEPGIRDEPPLAPDQPLRGGIAFRAPTITYPGAEVPALDGVRFELAAGATLAVVGRTGSGKSTLLSLIPRLVDPPPGTVFVDDVDVRRLRLAHLREQIAMVPQESILFSASVRENLALGRPQAGDDELLRAAGIAGLDRDLESFPRGLDTLVGERGVTLSGGQKQRLALARALLRDPAILLLDDCLSAVDTETEARILRRLEAVFKDRTVVLVSHRISTINQADRILVLDRGRVVERGTHRELLEQAGVYADLHRRQQLEEELAAV